MSIEVAYVSDVLCVWAYVAEARLTELRREFRDSVELRYHFIPVFGATENRIGQGWKDRGGYAGFGAHVREVAKGFPHASVDEGVWDHVVPTTSAKAHEALCVVRRLAEASVIESAPQADFDGRTPLEETIWRVRCAFFAEARDVSDINVLMDVFDSVNLPIPQIEAALRAGIGLAEMCRDIELRDEHRIEGSPTYYLNEGRQKLYGNVGYRVISANLRELLERSGNQASWC